MSRGVSSMLYVMYDIKKISQLSDVGVLRGQEHS